MMKARESGMPEESLWATFFDADAILAKLGLGAATGDVAEFGCGYGTFTVAAARAVRGVVHALDIDPEMLDATAAKARAAGVENVRLHLRDFMGEGSGLAGESIDYVMVFNILHCEEPVRLLQEAKRILVPGGRVGIVHWNHDPSTPRGPSMDIRPRPEQCVAWAKAAGLDVPQNTLLDLPPYHYGFVATRPPIAR